MLKITPGKNNPKTLNHVKRLPVNMRKAINQASRNVRKPIKDWTVNKMKEPKSGREYWVYVGQGGRPLKKPRLHKASAPNEIPAILTGRLRRSLGFSIKYGVSLTYGADTPYARKHEKSGRTYLARTLRAKEKDIYAELKQQAEKFLQVRNMK